MLHVTTFDYGAGNLQSLAALSVQFHPEKSFAAGVRFLRAFLEEARQ